jgi:hypothetical protein
MQLRAMREHAARRAWTITLQVRKVNSRVVGVQKHCEWPNPGLKTHERPAERQAEWCSALLLSCIPLLCGRPLGNGKHYESPAG